MTNIVPFRGTVVGPGVKLKAARVLAGARASKLTEVMISGYLPNGDLYVASTEGPGDALWLLEAAKMHLLTGGEH